METNAQYIIDALSLALSQANLDKAILSAQVRQLNETLAQKEDTIIESE